MTFINTYFQAEKNASLLLVGIALIALLVSLYLYLVVNQYYYDGVALSLSLIALIQLAVGIGIFFRSPKDTARVNNFATKDLAKINNEEIPRMEKVLKSFASYRTTEITLILLGFILQFALRDQPFWNGVGLGLSIQAALMLVFDYFAERRGHLYYEELRKLVQE